jgi:NAD(P)-dependent dehydrogenase (short-subunit alcohol dehydrogenase family)
MQLDLGDRAYLVTGGSRGIGREIAAALASEGARVAICGRDAGACDAVAGELGPQVVGIAGDVSSESGAAAVVAGTVEAFGRLDGIVNNAGRFGGGPLEGLARETLEEGLATKVTGPLHLVQQALPALRQSDRAAIVNISGVTAQRVTPGAAVTAIANTGVVALTAYLAHELMPADVRVNGVIPGYTRTGVWEQRAAALAEQEGVSPAEAMQLILDRQGMGHARWGEPEEIASVVVWLLSSASSFVNGISMRVDGGQLAVVTA